MRTSSPASFTCRSSSTTPLVGTSWAGARSSAQRRLADQVTRSASSPRRGHRGRSRRVGERVALRLEPAHAQFHRAVVSRRGELLRGLGPVPAVGDEQRGPTGDEHHPGRAAEPGQVTDVGQRRHEQCVHAGRVDPGPQASQPVGDLQRGNGAVERHGRGVAVRASSPPRPGRRARPCPRLPSDRARPSPGPGRSWRGSRRCRSLREQPGHGLDRQRVAQAAEAGDRPVARRRRPPRYGGRAPGRRDSRDGARPRSRRRRPGRRGATRSNA